MTLTLWQRLDKTGRNLAPFAVTVMLALGGMVPVPLPGYASVAPFLTAIAVYYWAIHRPDLMGPGTAFLIGLLQDLLTGGPLGVNALVLVLVHWAVSSQRRVLASSTFALMWFGFGLVMMGVACIQWLAFAALQASVLPFRPALFQALLTMAFFPAVAWMLIRVHRAFLQG
ncbi:rod shape-determining protein MreD [Azospirillum sp. YIM DDC1]|uniref:Rod shape-determining protein MreD n=1 Tax=Azospirillum aestuarii TaxID=2802052 RepID=A0ABS1HZ37_9PROT|nr:rod shape-determining protein MreD [Azospirillum aestuarii]MBK3776351.1 rod shape-determining protein MreD [Azospirillum brasilense]MBK4720089.1 rod shape-determining protein MreD [Azospirillum aestuarii]TWA89739.1 rod shape-determining protein MreD [Azospirillum brasilense]